MSFWMENAMQPNRHVRQLIEQMEREDIARNVSRQAVERARYGVCVECGMTLDGGWSRSYCRLHSERPLLPPLPQDAEQQP